MQSTNNQDIVKNNSNSEGVVSLLKNKYKKQE
jgi:hypothetical protein